MFVSAAMADDITFTFNATGEGVTVNINNVNMSMPGAGPVMVRDTAGMSFDLGAAALAVSSSNNNTEYLRAGPFLHAEYSGQSGVTQVSVTAPMCPGSCLEGSLNNGAYSAQAGQTGNWAGLFQVRSISPAILALFSDEDQAARPFGSDTFTTTSNVLGATSATALLGSGSISIQTFIVPEPASLGLLGAGLLSIFAWKSRR